MSKSSNKDILDNLVKEVQNYFTNKAKDFVTEILFEEPFLLFSIYFKLYDYYFITINYENGSIGAGILNGNYIMGIETNKKDLNDEIPLSDFMKEIDTEIQLRIPDKFLEAKGWKDCKNSKNIVNKDDIGLIDKIKIHLK